MGVYIKGMEMPKSYKDIRIYADGRVVSRSLHMYGEQIAIATPATAARPVVKAIWVEEEKDGEWHEYCSNCREHIPKGKWGQPWHSSYCPHCGAEMER